MLLKNGVTVVFTGHDHMYERTKPQNGITYFVVGSGGKLRSGGIDSAPASRRVDSIPTSPSWSPRSTAISCISTLSAARAA